ncbi:MAG: hypothetical protein WCO00_18240, partial [Rhodospirillaceae bacterium]
MVEPKVNGVRCVAVKERGRITLFSRSGTIYRNFGEVKTFLGEHMFDGTILDGEIIHQTLRASKALPPSTPCIVVNGTVFLPARPSRAAGRADRSHLQGYDPLARNAAVWSLLQPRVVRRRVKPALDGQLAFPFIESARETSPFRGRSRRA